jgi:hypothetical protein
MSTTTLSIRLSFFVLLLSVASCKKTTIINNPENKIPVANAGAAMTITLPTNTVTVNGSGSDSDGHIVAYLWSQVSGPAAVTIVNPGSASTQIKNFVQGTFTFQLMVTDNKGATGVGTMAVTVNPNPAPTTLTLQPSNNPNEWHVTNLNGQDQSGTGRPEITLATWTSAGSPWTLREVLKFDLSTIPSNASVLSANLFLYSNPNPSTGNLVDANFGSNNAFLVQQIATNWTTPLTWFNQPPGSTTNQVIVPHTTQSFLDLDINVTNLVSSMVNSNSNYGFLLKLQNESAYTSRIFISSFNNVLPAKRPKLVVVYQ